MEGMAGMEDTTDMTGMTSVAEGSSSASALAGAASTSTPVTSATSEAANSIEAAGSSAAQMGSMTSMSGMSSTFHFGTGDPLWTTTLTPTNAQGYAGAIILLVLMALFLRFLTTLRGTAERRWNHKQPSRCNSDEADNYLKMGQPREDDVEVGLGHSMLAVMTFNLGYLLAVLGGGFLGELALGWIKH
ncbi:hypothetical protein NKR23_g11420 [Pleurostoma richardsiae]|uniref:Copper transport protein n=1 Tax=Pleurostoma richardsiae TaxID=41990 RepID=A0AA38VBF1_9PEZI|nr:hypothetical protein NKR23_g11420 [Pleurostoma richardsiae]